MFYFMLRLVKSHTTLFRNISVILRCIFYNLYKNNLTENTMEEVKKLTTIKINNLIGNIFKRALHLF